ncbi:hypothetical protein CLU79DRAFT_780973 [Phycomyces nitens]|nr:hypothetical protein CLU79DRAFT_780973 [Phycomyces nitens]
MSQTLDSTKSITYNCGLCSLVTSSKSNYKRHMEKHSSKRQIFHCKICTKRFTTKFNLNRHQKVYHDEPIRLRFPDMFLN